MHSPISDAAPSPWPEQYPEGYAVVDVETTGLSRTDRIVSAAVYRLDARGSVLDHWYSPVNPGRDPGPVWIHGLTSQLLAAAPSFAEVADELAEQLAGRVLVAHNARFDWAMLAREFARCGTEARVEHRLCTIAFSKELALPLSDHRLPTLAAHFGVRPRQAHHALDDARVLVEVFQPSLRMAAAAGTRLPLQECRPMAPPERYEDASGAAQAGASETRSDSAPVPARRWNTFRPTRRRPSCPYVNPGRWLPEAPLVQGMRVVFTGDTAIDRETLEQRAEQLGLKVTSAVSSRTSLLVTNDRAATSSKALRARELNTPVLDEAAFLRLLESVSPGRLDSAQAQAQAAPPESAAEAGGQVEHAGERVEQPASRRRC